MEVLVATLLIAMAMGSIMAINARAISTLRESREVAASSQVLQQRIEMIRERSWTEFASAEALASMMRSRSESEAELSDPLFVETMRVTVPQPSAAGPVESDRFFLVQRTRGRSSIERMGDFSSEHTLLLEGTITWHSQRRIRTRSIRSIICRQGLTRSGIVGSVLGRPGTERGLP